MRLIDADTLTEEIKSLRCTLTGLRAWKGVLAHAANEYRKSILQIIQDQPTAMDREKTSPVGDVDRSEQIDRISIENAVETPFWMAVWAAEPGRMIDVRMSYDDLKTLCDLIDKRKNDGWIPVEERMPEEPKENPEFEGKKIELYLVTVKRTKYPFRAFWNGKQFTDGWSVLNVIAWHPLPETYQAERSGK